MFVTSYHYFKLNSKQTYFFLLVATLLNARVLNKKKRGKSYEFRSKD